MKKQSFCKTTPCTLHDTSSFKNKLHTRIVKLFLVEKIDFNLIQTFFYKTDNIILLYKRLCQLLYTKNVLINAANNNRLIFYCLSEDNIIKKLESVSLNIRSKI